MKLGKTIIITRMTAAGPSSLSVRPQTYILVLRCGPSGQEIIRTVHTIRYQRARHRVDDLMRIRIEPGIGLVIEITEVSG